ncbi:MAG: cytidine deaminase [Alphaproteobacteria bacterium]|nr:cytidine deaminase [Alphaproteobacteria bacterium]
MNNKQKLFDLAIKAAKNAYSPYSNFAVGAAILADDNNFYFGCNVENISYPVGTCAESGAIASMIANGAKQIKEILIFANSKTLIVPCGACRQRIAEFSTPQTLVHLADTEGVQKTYTIDELLPLSFSEF